MKTDLPQSFRRLEYRPPVYSIDQVELDIALDPVVRLLRVAWRWCQEKVLSLAPLWC